jgi:hypothetical protein
MRSGSILEVFIVFVIAMGGLFAGLFTLPRLAPSVSSESSWLL